MASSVEQVLKDIGPGISSRITAKLMEGGMTAAAARQQISRAKAMIEKWLKKVDVIHAVLKVDKRFKTAKFGFEYWTCGTFGADALALLEAENKKRTKITLRWRNGDEVRA